MTTQAPFSGDYHMAKSFALEAISGILPRSFNTHFCLAGGCFKSLIHNREPNDIDLWPCSESDRVSLLLELTNQGSVIESENQFHTILQRPGSPRIEVAKKVCSSLDVCLSNFDLVFSCVGAEFDSGNLVDFHAHDDISKDIVKQEVRIVDRLKPHRYNLLTLRRIQRYAIELGFSIPQDTIDNLWRTTYLSASTEERKALLQAAKLSLSDVPKEFRVEKVFIDGHPSEKCRPFSDRELDELKSKLLGFRNIERKHEHYKTPKALYVAGLAGSGKTTVIKQVIQQLDLGSIAEMVNLDMDGLRSHHSQFSALLHGVSSNGNEEKRLVFKDLIQWFNEGSNAEYAIYKTPDCIAQEILKERRDFILPIHWYVIILFNYYLGIMKLILY